MQLFDLLNPQLFKPLAGRNQVYFADVLLLIWSRCKRSADYSLAKSELYELVEEYFSGLALTLPLEDDLEEGAESTADNSKDPHVLMLSFLFRLKNTGWLEDLEGGYEEEARIAVNHRVVALLQGMDSLLHPKQTAYSGKLFKVYQLLKGLADEKNPYENVLLEISADMDSLNGSLRQLNASIGTYIDQLTRNKTPEQVLELFNEYETKVVIAAYHRFKTSDNLFKYRTFLQDGLDACETVYFERLAEDCCNMEQLSQADGMVTVRTLIQKLRDDLDGMSELIGIIDQSHINYRKRAVQRARFLLLSDSSTQGKINELLRYYSLTVKTPGELGELDETPLGQNIRIFPVVPLGERFLSTPTSSRKPTPIDALMMEEPMEAAELQREQALLLQYAKQAVTEENVNLFARTVLGNHQSLHAAELAETHSEEFVKIIGLHTYSESLHRNYEITMSDHWVTKGGFRFQDFTVRRRV